jgi:hypothetical protein
MNGQDSKTFTLFPELGEKTPWTKAECAEAFQLSLRRINSLYQDGVLSGENSVTLTQQYLEFLRRGDPDIGIQKLRYQTARSDREELEVKRLKGELVPISKVIDDVSIILNGLKMRILGWSRSLPGRICHKGEVECSAILGEETSFILRELSQGIERIFGKKIS